MIIALIVVYLLVLLFLSFGIPPIGPFGLFILCLLMGFAPGAIFFAVATVISVIVCFVIAPDSPLKRRRRFS